MIIYEWAQSEVLTWQDLALRIKSDCKRALISQVRHLSVLLLLLAGYTPIILSLQPVKMINSGSEKACDQNRKKKQN